MPISRDQFKRGEDAETYQLRKIFVENPEKAFSFEELADKMNIPNDEMSRLIFGLTLVSFTFSGFIETKAIGNVQYYALKKRSKEYKG